MPEFTFEMQEFVRDGLIKTKIAHLIAEEFGIDYDSLPNRIGGRKDKFDRAAARAVDEIRSVSRETKQRELGKLLSEIALMDDALSGLSA